MKLNSLMMIAATAALTTTAVHAQRFTTPAPAQTTTTVVVPAQPAVVVAEPAGAATVRTEHESNWSPRDRFTYVHEGELFLPNEFSLDAFGTYTTTRRRNLGELFTHNIRHGTFGGGLGLNYFVTKYIGLSTDMEMSDNGGRFIDSATANVVLRLPLDAAHLAPYVFAGGGAQIDPTSQFLGDVGAGLDFRLNHWTGIFIDGRYVWTAKSGDYGLFRSGLRFAF